MIAGKTIALTRWTFVGKAIWNNKQNEIKPFAATRMDLEVIILSEVSQKEKNQYNTVSLICGI